MAPPEPQSSPPKQPRTSRWLVAGWVVVAAVLAYRHIPVARASHSHTGSYQIHVASMHANSTGSGPGANDEQYCILNLSSSINASTMADFIQETLTQLDFDIVWDGTGDWRVDLWRTSLFCNQYDTATRNTIELEYRIKDSWATECGGDIYSCVVHANPLVDPVDGHTHFKWMNSLLKTSHVWGYDTRARKFINHETGHILGLMDPSYYGHCSHSVMHNDLYSSMGCTDTVWYPTTADFNSVVSVMDRTN